MDEKEWPSSLRRAPKRLRPRACTLWTVEGVTIRARRNFKRRNFCAITMTGLVFAWLWHTATWVGNPTRLFHRSTFPPKKETTKWRSFLYETWGQGRGLLRREHGMEKVHTFKASSRNCARNQASSTTTFIRSLALSHSVKLSTWIQVWCSIFFKKGVDLTAHTQGASYQLAIKKRPHQSSFYRFRNNRRMLSAGGINKRNSQKLIDCVSRLNHWFQNDSPSFSRKYYSSEINQFNPKKKSISEKRVISQRRSCRRSFG